MKPPFPPQGVRRTESALLLAFISLGLWSSLAYLGTRLAHLAPLLVTGIALSIGGLVSIPSCRHWRVPRKTFAVGVAGIFGYHALYFTAFQLAPAVEVNLINYLWPLLLVVLSPCLLPEHPLKGRHVLGALFGLAGAALIALPLRAGRPHLDLAHLPGYLCAAAAALLWATYSLLTKRLPAFRTEAVGGFCLSSGLLSLALFALESRGGGGGGIPSGSDWILLVLMGTGPMGLSFFTWSAAMKRGDPRVIGALSYLTPLASTLLLIGTGGRSLTATSGGAMILILTGAAIGSLGH